MLDIVMPGMSGNDLYQAIRDDLGLVELPVVAYTAHGDITNRVLMRMAGFTDYLPKPASGRTLDAVLSRVMAHA